MKRMSIKEEKRKKTGMERSFIVLVIVLFFILAVVVFSVSRSVSTEMSEAAIGNLSESLEMIQGTIETILEMEADFQKEIAKQLARAENPENYLYSYESSRMMVKLSLVLTGEREGVSNSGDLFSPDELDFSTGNMVEGLPISRSYLNSMGTWAYTISCPVLRDEQEIATLYVEYVYDILDDALPDNFYNTNATLYLMDTTSERLVLKPKGMGERDAGHLNLEDFCRANNIIEKPVRDMIAENLDSGKNVMFYHNVQGREALIYMWAVEENAIYLIGYVPVEAIQREGTAVNQNIYIVVASMLVAFLACFVLFFLTERQKSKIRKEQEEERRIHNKQLAEALQAAQIASHSKTTFLANMSHDIRTPMNAILGFAALLAKNADSPARVRDYTKKITASGQHLLGLINDVLDVSKIESGKVVLTIGEFALNHVVASVDSIIRPAAKAKGQEFEIIVTGVKHELLVGDETRLNQILLNLLSNAVKYTGEGGTIWFRIIGLEQRSPQYEHIRIEVEDNGFGMTPEYLNVIFDAFTRAENSTTNKVQGTGLGMAITKNIVELMGGTIQVSSEVDKGTIFTVDLELRIPDEKIEERFWEHHGISRILTVDDDEEICQNIRMLMEDSGVQVDVAFSGEEGIRKVQECYGQGGHYDVILLDWQMPQHMSGLETAKELRKILPDFVPVFFLTSYDWDEIENEATGARVDGHLTKPFFVSAFRELLLEMEMTASRRHIETLKSPSSSEEFATEGHDSLEGHHFLVAEDNEINAEIVQEFLDMDGATCELVENGQMALERFRDTEPGRFDAILMDVQMPVMNGYEATKAIRALEREDAKTIPIIAMTANAFSEDVKEAIDAGMDAHVAKPIDMELLRIAVNQFSKRRN
ncbi:MAG: response regulator [Lachnospiraceae bacterium]|nr:response regulator [Lachnospiraceae bacterium]